MPSRKGTLQGLAYFHALQTKILKSMGMMKEFKEFAMRGNLVDTAVAL